MTLNIDTNFINRKIGHLTSGLTRNRHKMLAIAGVLIEFAITYLGCILLYAGLAVTLGPILGFITYCLAVGVFIYHTYNREDNFAIVIGSLFA